jgi:molecular chaperone GrpE
MENREQRPKRIPINFEAESDSTATEAEGKEAPQSQDGVDAAQTVELEQSQEQPESSDSNEEALADNQNLSPAEVAQVLIDLSEALERSAKLTEEKKLLYDQLVRRQAEFENFRKRIDRERVETQGKARADILTELLPVLDNLERALGSGVQTEKTEGVNEGIVAGVKLIHKQFLDVLTGLGLTTIKAIGEPFDPHVHEAVTTEINKQYPENTVIEELQRGYKLGDRLLRPAMVKVAVRE